MDQGSAGELLRRICAWAEQRPDIRALVLTGSHTRGQADNLSDLDLEFFTREPERYVQSDRWMADIGAVGVYLSLQNDRGLPTRLVIFDDGLKADFTICPVAALVDGVRTRKLAPLYERGYRVLVDKDGMAGRLPAASLKPSASVPPTEEAFTNIVREFWFEIYHVAKYLKRGDLWAVKYRDWMTKELLLTMLGWNERALHGWDRQTEHLGIRMEEWVGPEVWARLMGAFAHFDAADSWKALDVTADLFRRVAQETASRLGYCYPQDVDERLSRYVESLRGQ